MIIRVMNSWEYEWTSMYSWTPLPAARALICASRPLFSGESPAAAPL